MSKHLYILNSIKMDMELSYVNEGTFNAGELERSIGEGSSVAYAGTSNHLLLGSEEDEKTALQRLSSDEFLVVDFGKMNKDKKMVVYNKETSAFEAVDANVEHGDRSSRFEFGGHVFNTYRAHGRGIDDEVYVATSREAGQSDEPMTINVYQTWKSAPIEDRDLIRERLASILVARLDNLQFHSEPVGDSYRFIHPHNSESAVRFLDMFTKFDNERVKQFGDLFAGPRSADVFYEEFFKLLGSDYRDEKGDAELLAEGVSAVRKIE